MVRGDLSIKLKYGWKWSIDDLEMDRRSWNMKMVKKMWRYIIVLLWNCHGNLIKVLYEDEGRKGSDE